jgi:DNA ligase-associated metallophosphoesterase
MTPPPSGSLKILFAGQAMWLLPSRAIYWPASASIVIADLHLGKAASFRMHGIPVPAGSTTRDLSRISAILQETGARRLVILGDFLHARAGRQPEVLEEMSRWRAKHEKLDILLIPGNHDRSAGHVLDDWRMQEVEEPYLDHGLALMHDPATVTSAPSLAGHIHPVTSLRDFDGSSVNIPSFIQDGSQLVLPAFGTFTGGYKVAHAEGRRAFLVMSGRVIAF